MKKLIGGFSVCVAVLGSASLVYGCGDDETASGTSGAGGRDAGAGGVGGSGGADGSAGSPEGGVGPPGCDPLVPTYCAFPFPSNLHTERDATTKTGLRVAFKPEIFPLTSSGKRALPDPWSRSDGFSPGGPMLAHFLGVTLNGVPTPETLARSLEADCPTVLIDAETGERVPHFAELDMSGTDATNRAFMIWPVVRLGDARRYIVAMRKLEGASGVLPPTPAFKALRDDETFGDPSIEARRALYVDIFKRLEDAGVARADLQLAWDFTTASRENNTGWMVHMRDEALAAAGTSGPSYVIDSADPNVDPTNIAFHVKGRMMVPLYLDNPGPGGKLVFGSDGMPEPNPAQPTYEVPFDVLIPVSAAQAPAALIEYGHGLLGSRSQINNGNFRSFMNQYNYVFFGVDLVGMASDDLFFILGNVGSGELHLLAPMYDRLHQGMLNYLLAMRMMIQAFSKDATYGKYIEPTQRFYHGISQGGIFGGMYMGLTTDVTRGVLEVMGQPYNILLNRSVDFDRFFVPFTEAYPNSLDQQFGLAAVQMLWDRAEPNGYTPYIRQNMLPNTPAHEVLMRAAIGDHQVSTLGAHTMARAVGAKHVDTGLRDIFQLEKVASVEAGSSYFEYAFGLPPEPLCNKPMRACADPHGKVRVLNEARQQMNEFFKTGRSTNFCAQNSCSFPTQSGCMPGETTPPCN